MRAAVNAITRKGDIVLLHHDGTESVVRSEYVAYFKTADARWREWVRDRRVVTAKVEGEWVRVAYRASYWDRELGKFVDHRVEACRDLPVFEADVHPIRRYVADTGLDIARPKRVYLDIETDSRVRIVEAIEGKARVLCWVLVDEAGAVTRGVLQSDTDEAESDLLRSLWSALAEYHQVVAWNGDHFDFPVLKLRSKHLDLGVDTRRWLWLDHMLAFKRYNIMSASSGEEKQSFALNSIAVALLGEGKHDLVASKTYEVWCEDPQRLVDYCAQDTHLLRKIENKTGYLELFQTICEVCKIFPDSRSLKPTKQVDGFMLRLGVERGVHFPTIWYGEEKEDSEQFEGAYVMKPTCRGITRDVHVLDFSSMYPTIMISWNLSPEVKLARDAVGCVSPLTGVVTRTDAKGLLASALEELLALRSSWKKKRADLTPGTPEAKEAERRTNAYKQVANGFYGVMGNIHSRFFDVEIAESTTTNGQWLIKKTTEAAGERGIDCIYVDTDGAYFVGTTREKFAEFVKWCNSDLYPRLLAEQRCVTNAVKISFEKSYEWIVFTAAKRYVAKLSYYEGAPATADSEPEIKGLEYKRGDANRVAREMQKLVIGELVDGHHEPDHYFGIIQRYLDRILDEPLPLEDVVLSKSLTQEPEEYAAAMSHVKVAELLRDRGEDIVVGDRVGYVVTDASVSPMKVIPSSDYDGTLDRYYLWERRVYPPTQRLLESAFPDYTRWKKWSKVRPKSPRRGGPGDGQLGLGI